MQNCLSHLLRLSLLPSTTVPIITVSSNEGPTTDQRVAPWSSTAAETTAFEVSLLPTLVHLAIAKDDVEGLSFCLEHQQAPNTLSEWQCFDGAGIVNSRDPCSGWSPLHTAAFNNSKKCLDLLLQAGALVHLRDALGHTALYYVCISPPPQSYD